MNYRADIDGLRALAVLPVVLFHLGGTSFHGGFVGVDIFFVISGYLITSIIVSELNAGDFSLARFYERRIRRIFPALFFILALSSIAASFLLFTPDFAYFGESLAATAAFGSNMLFWQKSGYFEADAITVPLLHTWSLGVEEQFYIFFPLFLMLLHKFARRFVVPLVVLGALVSLALSAWVAHVGSSAVLFYLLPTRAWELLAGSILACVTLRAPRENIAHGLGLVGFALIAYGWFAFDSDTVFPGINALPPVLGAVLLILAGANAKALSARVLGSSIPVFFGKISYSLYLWHWPVIVFLKYAAPFAWTPLVSVLVFAGCTLASYLSWRFIEQPARHTILGRRKIFVLAFGVSFVFIALGLLIACKKGLPDRFPPAIQKMLTVTGERGLTLMPDPLPENYNGYRYVLGNEKAKPSFLVWGDSHASAASYGIDFAARDLRKQGYLMGAHSCVPSFTDQKLMSSECNAINRAVVDTLRKHPEIKTVVLVGHWSIHEIRFAKKYKLNEVESPTLFRDTLDGLFTALETERRKIVFMGEMPHAPVENVPLEMTRAAYYQRPVDLHYDLKVHEERIKGVDFALDYLREKHAFKFVDPTVTFCPEGICAMGNGDHPYFSDNNHITAYGAELFKDMYAPLLE